MCSGSAALFVCTRTDRRHDIHFIHITLDNRLQPISPQSAKYLIDAVCGIEGVGFVIISCVCTN